MDGRALVGRSCTTLQFCFTVKVESVQMSFSFVAQNCPFCVSLFSNCYCFFKNMLVNLAVFIFYVVGFFGFCC